MAKAKTISIPTSTPPEQPQTGPVAQPPEPPVSPVPPQYSFPTKSRCPRCGALDTIARRTKGDTQYRECQRAICRHRYAVKGTAV
jgi:hypothetical protein